MDFIYETGEGLPDANSYLSVEEFIDYAIMLGHDVDGLDDETMERRLMRGTIILDADFRNRFPGNRATGEQSLEFPRTGAFYIDGATIANDVIPKELKMALTEIFFLLEAGTNLQPVIAPSGNLTMERIKVDSIEEERRFSSWSGSQLSTYKIIEDALARITGGIPSLYDIKISRTGGQF